MKISPCSRNLNRTAGEGYATRHEIGIAIDQPFRGLGNRCRESFIATIEERNAGRCRATDGDRKIEGQKNVAWPIFLSFKSFCPS
jgi:hypothetical protein